MNQFDSLSIIIDDILSQVPDSILQYQQHFLSTVAASVIEVVTQYDVSQYSQIEIERVIRAIIEDAIPQLNTSIASSLSSSIADGIANAERVYSEFIQNAGYRTVLAQSAIATDIANQFQQTMSIKNQELLDASVRILSEQIKKGSIDQDVLISEMRIASGATLGHVRTQAQTTVAVYNQAYLNLTAEKANLDHYKYTGNIMSSTRAFCRACLNKIYTRQQIDEMDNAMLNPVLIYRGGWRCRHIWMPVDVEWLPEFSSQIAKGEWVSIPLSSRENARQLRVLVTPEERQIVELSVKRSQQ